MKLFPCSKQKEVRAALREGCWPAGCLPALRAHVAGCHQCSDLVLVAQALEQARSETTRETVSGPALVSPEVLWWRSELRRRSGAIERMTRPVAIAERLALAGVPLALLGLVVWQWNQIIGWLTDASNLFRPNDAAVLPGTPEVISLVLIASVGGFILISMLALFLLTENE